MSKELKYKGIKGMPDIFEEKAAAMRWLESKARDVFDIFEFREIRTPLLEETKVFTRSIGENTDIVEKEMYSFVHRGGKNISLRPEGTASIIRAYIEHGLHNSAASDLVKLYYMGPMFRAERPQKGRLRQFHQIGAEIIGGSDSNIDAEIIVSLNEFLHQLGIEGFSILINSLGCNKDRNNYKKALIDYLSDKDEGLCENCKRRSKTNVLRVLDCKGKTCKTVIGKAPAILEYLCSSCRDNYNSLKKNLTQLKIPFKEKKDLVRGLDYYTGIIFEVVHPSLGVQDAIAAGGRYDDLTRQMGGPDVGATGYAVGVERLLLVLGDTKKYMSNPGVLIIPLDENYKQESFRTAINLRKQGIRCEAGDSKRSFKSLLRRANKEGREFVLIIGEEEIAKNKLSIKNMKNGEQEVLSFDEIVERLRKDDQNT